MDQFTKMTEKLDKKAGGNTGVLNLIYKTAMKTIRSTCKTEEEYEAKCQAFLDTICAKMGEENRAFYAEYMARMKGSGK